MGWFTPKITPHELEYVRSRMNQLQDSVTLLNTTVKPDVFFKRLNFTLDILLDLKNYEKYGIFKGNTPSNDYNRIIRTMESIVDDFIDRAIEDNERRQAALKTQSARDKNYDKFVTTLISAFDCAHTFWSGSYNQSRTCPHYTGPLFTQNNYKRVKSLFYDLERK